MKKYLVCLSGNEACDHSSIGCGSVYYFVTAENIQEVEEGIVWPDGKDEYCSFSAEDPIKEIIIIPIESEKLHYTDIKKYIRENYMIREAARKDEEKEKDLEILARLKEKYE